MKRAKSSCFPEFIARAPALQLIASFCGSFEVFSRPDGSTTVVIDYGAQRANNSPRPTNNIWGRYGNPHFSWRERCIQFRFARAF